MKKKILLRFTSLAMALVLSACGGQTNPRVSDPPAIPVVNNESAASSSTIRIALLLDTSNSMDGLIDQAKSQLWKIVNELSKAQKDTIKPDLQIALYEYGNDNLDIMKGYIRQVTPLTNDLDKISQELFALKTMGGSEFCAQVIMASLDQLVWNIKGNDLQYIFIAGNEPFDQGGIAYTAACTKASEKKVVINTIYCGDYNEGIAELWNQGASLTGGTYMNIDQDQKIIYIDTPYDVQINEMNTKLNDTYIYYGASGNVAKNNQIVQDANSMSYGSANATERSISKSKHVYKNESWDLVDASKQKGFAYNKVSKSSLPEEAQKMTDEQLKVYVETKGKERAEIQAKIAKLSVEREKYIEEKKKSMKEDEKSLDAALISAVKQQAANKGYTFK